MSSIINIVSSGFGDSFVASRIKAVDISGSIGKPYGFGLFQQVLQNVLDNKPVTSGDQGG